MMKKINWILVNVVTFVIIALLLFMPLFTLDEVGTSDLDGKLIFGYHFVAGLNVQNGEGLSQFSQVIASTLTGLAPILMLLSMFAINKIIKSEFGKKFINFLCLLVVFMYSFLLPVISYTFLNELYADRIIFNKIWGYWVNVVIIGIVLIYCIVDVVMDLIKKYKEIKAKETN